MHGSCSISLSRSNHHLSVGSFVLHNHGQRGIEEKGRPESGRPTRLFMLQYLTMALSEPPCPCAAATAIPLSIPLDLTCAQRARPRCHVITEAASTCPPGNRVFSSPPSLLCPAQYSLYALACPTLCPGQLLLYDTIVVDRSNMRRADAKVAERGPGIPSIVPKPDS